MTTFLCLRRVIFSYTKLTLQSHLPPPNVWRTERWRRSDEYFNDPFVTINYLRDNISSWAQFEIRGLQVVRMLISRMFSRNLIASHIARTTESTYARWMQVGTQRASEMPLFHSSFLAIVILVALPLDNWRGINVVARENELSPEFNDKMINRIAKVDLVSMSNSRSHCTCGFLPTRITINGRNLIQRRVLINVMTRALLHFRGTRDWQRPTSNYTKVTWKGGPLPLPFHVALIGRREVVDGGVVLVAVSCFWARGDHQRHKPQSVCGGGRLRWTIPAAVRVGELTAAAAEDEDYGKDLVILIFNGVLSGKERTWDWRINQRHFYRQSLLSLKWSLREITDHANGPVAERFISRHVITNL